jgi:hypothetical protein
MADNVTLTELIAKCRRLSNQETADEAQALCTDLEITERLNANLRAVYEMLVAARGAGFYRTIYTFSTVEGTSDYPLPAAFLAVLGVHVTQANGRRTPIFEAQEPEVAELETATATYPARYQLRVNNLTFLPTPGAAFSCRLVYTPAYVNLVLGTDTFDGVLGFEEAAVWRTVAEMQSKDQADTGFAILRIAEWDARVARVAESRVGQPPKIQRVFNRRWYR